MTLDELVSAIPDEDSDLRADLGRWLEDWKQSDATIEDLVSLIEKWHGNVWFKSHEASDLFFQNWERYKENTITGIVHLSLQEQLNCFSLSEHWEQCDDDGRNRLKIKMILK